MADTDMNMSIALARAKRNFSYRLFEALSTNKRGANRFLYWSKDGTSFYVDVTDFEQQVMYAFPGLVATPSFKNFYRQVRVYGFDSLGSGCEGKQQFCHPYFMKGREDLLIHVHSTMNKGTRRRRHQTSMGASPGGMSNSFSNTSMSPRGSTSSGMMMDLSCSGDRAAPYAYLPDKAKYRSDAACQTMISMETFARLDPRDVSVSALMLPALVGFLDNCTEERETHQYREQINQEFQLLSPPQQPQRVMKSEMSPVKPLSQAHFFSQQQPPHPVQVYHAVPIPNPVSSAIGQVQPLMMSPPYSQGYHADRSRPSFLQAPPTVTITTSTPINTSEISDMNANMNHHDDNVNNNNNHDNCEMPPMQEVSVVTVEHVSDDEEGDGESKAEVRTLFKL